jgi:uncharacterized protein YacL
MRHYQAVLSKFSLIKAKIKVILTCFLSPISFRHIFKTGKEIMDLFKSLNKEGQTIGMVTHNPENTAYSTRTISLRDGRVDAVSIA